MVKKDGVHPETGEVVEQAEPVIVGEGFQRRAVGVHDQLYDEFERYKPDPTPMAPPIGYNPQPSLAEQIRAMVRSSQLALEAERLGAETFEEADDFEMDDVDPSSPYEENFDPVPARELKARRKKAEDEAAAAAAAEAAKAPPATT